MARGLSEHMEARIIDQGIRGQEFDAIIRGEAPVIPTSPEATAARIGALLDLGAEALVRTDTRPIPVVVENVDTLELPIINPDQIAGEL
ncbi:hypothetical protein EPN95_01160 [Patescibacteria group bacterium]|nr:MAG: hypothetical protein EPN95_01160 [Patescibacteria group bacterium]